MKLAAGRILMSAGVDQTHYLFSAKIGRQLVQRGHQVTFLLSSSYIPRRNGSDADWFDFQVYSSPYSPSEMKEMTHRFALEALNSTYQSSGSYTKLLLSRLTGLGGEKTDEEKREELKPTKPMSKYLTFECNILHADDDLMRRLRAAHYDIMTFDLA